MIDAKLFSHTTNITENRDANYFIQYLIYIYYSYYFYSKYLVNMLNKNATL